MQKKKIVVLGAGISGLAVAHYLNKKHDQFDVQILEKSQRVGGWIDSDTSTGFFFERGPRMFRTSPAFLNLISDIGMEKEMILSNPHAKGRYLWMDEKLHRMPLFSWDLVKAILKEWRVQPKLDGDESVWDFACRRFNPTVAKQIFEPMVLGIYGGDSREISMKAGLATFKNLEEKHGSLIKGFLKSKKSSYLFNFQRGMKSFIKKLEDKMTTQIRFGVDITGIKQTSTGFEVVTSQGVYEADFLFSGLPCPVIGRLLLPELQQISLRGTTLVHLGYHEKVLKKKGFGYLVSPQEKSELLGTVFDSNMFTQLNRGSDETRLTVMLKKEDASDAEARDLALRGLKNHLGITKQPDVSMVIRAPQVFPQLKVGHLHFIERVEKQVREQYPRLFLAGNYLYGVGVNDCIVRAQSVVENFLSTVAS